MAAQPRRCTARHRCIVRRRGRRRATQQRFVGTYYPAPAREPIRHTKRDAAIGAAAGAVIGATASRDKVKGGLIGAAAGGILGGIIGHTVDVQRAASRRTPAATRRGHDYDTAHANPGVGSVVSCDRRVQCANVCSDAASGAACFSLRGSAMSEGDGQMMETTTDDKPEGAGATKASHGRQPGDRRDQGAARRASIAARAVRRPAEQLRELDAVPRRARALVRRLDSLEQRAARAHARSTRIRSGS